MVYEPSLTVGVGSLAVPSYMYSVVLNVIVGLLTVLAAIVVVMVPAVVHTLDTTSPDNFQYTV